ncbi:MAG: phosphatidylglycerophosphatase A [Blastocatellia bacterium]|nr:phosphatidylglycerophosphatase A [Blastocatellia bacterium]
MSGYAAVDRIACFLATGAGAGRAPIAPGTVGALEGVILYLAVTALPLTPRELLLTLVALNVLVFGVGIWASGRAAKMLGLEDPGQVVIDEVSGQLIALTPLALAPSIAGVVVAFSLFRLFDIFKPYPIRKLERLRAGFGIMMDDALAGVYAAAIVWIGIQASVL